MYKRQTTNSSDHADLLTAVQLAVDANPDMTFDPVTGAITFTSPADSTAMPDLVIGLPLTDDNLVEGLEDFTLGFKQCDFFNRRNGRG